MEGQQYEKKGNVVQAYIFYSEASAADPANKKYRVKMNALRTRAALESKVMPAASGASDSAVVEDFADEPPPTAKETRDARQPQPPFELNALPGTKNIDIRGDSKSLYEQVAKLYGLDLVFDGEYQATPPQRLRLDDANYRDALYALMAATSSFIVPISGRVFLVAQDSVQKRTAVENNVALELPIPEPVTLQDAQELGRAVQQVMELQRFAINASDRTVYFRDRVSKAYAAQELMKQLLYQRAQVSIEVQLLTVSKRNILNYGIPIPTEVSATSFGQFGKKALIDFTKLSRFWTLGGGQTLFGVAILSTQLLANISKSESRSLMDLEVRSMDGQVANFHVGDKYPIQTQGYNLGSQAGKSTGFAPSFTFEDLGLVLKVTPKVHGTEEVTLDVDAEFKVLGSGSVNGIPVISNRKFITQVRLRFDEWASVSGLLTTSQAKLISGIAGVTSVPLLGPLLSNTTRDDSEDQTWVLIRPRLLNLPPSEAIRPAIFVGPDTRPRTPL